MLDLSTSSPPTKHRMSSPAQLVSSLSPFLRLIHRRGSPDVNYCPHCFQSRGPAAVRARGGGAPWPHFNGERAENGNYIESEEVAKRHGICGDPEQVWLMVSGTRSVDAAAFVGSGGGQL